MLEKLDDNVVLQCFLNLDVLGNCPLTSTFGKHICTLSSDVFQHKCGPCLTYLERLSPIVCVDFLKCLTVDNSAPHASWGYFCTLVIVSTDFNVKYNTRVSACVGYCTDILESR